MWSRYYCSIIKYWNEMLKIPCWNSKSSRMHRVLYSRKTVLHRTAMHFFQWWSSKKYSVIITSFYDPYMHHCKLPLNMLLYVSSQCKWQHYLPLVIFNNTVLQNKTVTMACYFCSKDRVGNCTCERHSTVLWQATILISLFILLVF